MTLVSIKPDILTAPQITGDHLVLAMRMRVELKETPEFTRALIIDELMDRGLSEENASVIEQVAKILHESGIKEQSLHD